MITLMRGFLLNMLLAIICYGQSVKQLDQINGFKEFKLGSNISQYLDKYDLEPYHSDIKPENDWSYGLSNEHLEKYDFSIGGKKPTGLGLEAFNNKIYVINLYFNDLPIDVIKEAFGPPTKVTDELSIYNAYRSSEYNTDTYYWEGEKVKLSWEGRANKDPIYTTDMFGEIDVSFGPMYQQIILEITVKDEKELKGINSNSSSNIISDFGSTTVEIVNKEPCGFRNIQRMNVLSKSWLSGEDFILSSSDNSMVDNDMFYINIARNKERPILLINYNYEFHGFNTPTFSGNLVLFLKNGETITCVDRGLTGTQTNGNITTTTFAVYYLTMGEYRLLEKEAVGSLKCKLDRSNKVFNGIDISFRCDIERIDSQLK